MRIVEYFRLGEEVGYSVRFQHVSSSNTIIKYMTDGMLVQEFMVDPSIKKYSCIILDEAHERTVNTDTLCALLKRIVKVRPELKIIVSSATLDTIKFSHFFPQVKLYS